MKIVSAQFAGSSTGVSKGPAAKLPEFAFIGRSNVGKSSLINMLTGRKKLAMTSQTPGKTRLINHFLINDRWYLVDLPGYGFAKVPDAVRKEISRMINLYLSGSESLAVLFVLIDARHDLQQIDRDFLASLGEAGIPFSIVFTKCDKMGPVAAEKQVSRIKEALLEDWESLPPAFMSSSVSGAGRDEILSYIGSILESIS